MQAEVQKAKINCSSLTCLHHPTHSFKTLYNCIRWYTMRVLYNSDVDRTSWPCCSKNTQTTCIILASALLFLQKVYFETSTKRSTWWRLRYAHDKLACLKLVVYRLEMLWMSKERIVVLLVFCRFFRMNVNTFDLGILRLTNVDNNYYKANSLELVKGNIKRK